MNDLMKRVARSLPPAGWPVQTVLACDPSDDLAKFVEARRERDDWCIQNCRGGWQSADPGDMLRLHYRFDRDAEAAMFRLRFDDATVVHRRGDAGAAAR